MLGYGSLVSPDSFGRTLGRPLRPGADFFVAELAGFGRRWNYGVMLTQGHWVDHSGQQHARTIVALGVVAVAALVGVGLVVTSGGRSLPFPHHVRYSARTHMSQGRAQSCAVQANSPGYAG